MQVRIYRIHFWITQIALFLNILVSAAADTSITSLSASPVAGHFDSDGSTRFQFSLGAGDSVSFHLSGLGNDMDLFLYDASTPTYWLRESAFEDYNYESIDYQTHTPGSFHLEIRSEGAALYTLSYSIRRAAPEDKIPGIALPRSPFTHFLNTLDGWDVYRIDLSAGRLFKVTLRSQELNSTSLFLYAPDALNIDDAEPIARPFYYSKEAVLEFKPIKSGRYYIYVAGSPDYISSYFDFDYDYTLEYSISDIGNPGNENIPGDQLPASPITKSVDLRQDRHDVFHFQLNAGQAIRAILQGGGESDIDLYLYPPTSSSIYLAPYFAIGSYSPKAHESFTYAAKASGTHYLDVAAYDRYSTYTLTYYIYQRMPDDDIPGIEPPSTSFDGELSTGTDLWDVYRVYLVRGSHLHGTLTGDPETDFDVVLYADYQSSVLDSPPHAEAGPRHHSYPEPFNLGIDRTGYYYWVITSPDQSGRYHFEYTIAPPNGTHDWILYQ